MHSALLASTSAPSLNFYFVTPSACAIAITGATVNGSATFKASPRSLVLDAETYEICATDAAGTLLFASGPTGVVLPLANANFFQQAVYDATATADGNGSAVLLSLLDNAGGSGALYNLKN